MVPDGPVNVPPQPDIYYPHDDVIKWKHFPRYWPFVRGIHRSSVNSPHKGQWRGAVMFSLIFVWINGWVSNCEAGYLRRYCAHYDVSAMHIIAVITFIALAQYVNVNLLPQHDRHPSHVIAVSSSFICPVNVPTCYSLSKKATIMWSNFFYPRLSKVSDY